MEDVSNAWLDAEELATGDYEDDQSILKIIDDKKNIARDKMAQIDVKWDSLCIQKTKNGRIPKEHMAIIERRVEEIEFTQKRWLHRKKLAENNLVKRFIFLL